MTKTRTDPSGTSTPMAVDLHDGIPDRAAKPSRHRLLWVLAAFGAWVAVLVYFWLAN